MDWSSLDEYSCGKRIHGINPTFITWFGKKKIIKNTIGMFLIHIGTTKSLETILIYLLKNVWSLKNGIDNITS
jgi:hypothetical protein